jgi:hypothetical protein
MKNRKVKQVFLGVGASGKREDVEEGCKRMNAVEILCTHL